MKSIPMVSQCMLIGDNRKYCSALLTLDVGAILRDVHGLDGAPRSPRTRASSWPSWLIGQTCRSTPQWGVLRITSSVLQWRVEPEVQQPRAGQEVHSVPRDLSVDHGELTPTLKIRRKQIRENWAADIEAMYADA
ncbi:MAG: hypothetical protein Ct9H300mP10_03900 [Methanobacteriota archaeon]|nr:MAG: hypothetical protein Ct9H300mP10_03900 [Euryarchaeota archaeon]